MNRKMINTQEEALQQNNGEYAVRRNRRATLIAAAVCLVLAFFFWVLIMGNSDSDYVAVCVLNPDENYIYTLSVDFVEVEGTVGTLRHADYVGVRVPEKAVSGVFSLTVDDLVLPDGVHLTAEPEITLTVRAK